MMFDLDLSTTDAFSLKRLPAGSGRTWTGVADVVTSRELKEWIRRDQLTREAREGAEALISKAEAEAATVVQRARQQARAMGDSQLRIWQEAFDVRQAEISESLGSAVSVVVNAVLRQLLGSSDDLPVKVTIELAMKVLQAELRAAAVCHPLDLPMVQSQAERLGTKEVRGDERLVRGQIVFSGEEGDVRIDGDRVLERLANDLRLSLSSPSLFTPS